MTSENPNNFMIFTYLYVFFALWNCCVGKQTNECGVGGIRYFLLEKLEIRNNRCIFVHENTMVYHNYKH